MDAETPATLEIGWLRNDTYCEGYAEVGLGWFFWVKRIIKLLEDSVSLITINHHLDGALEKLIVTNNGDETNRKTIMDSVIRIQKMIEEAQYRFTKLAAALNDSSRESIVGNNSGSQVDGGLMFNTFLKTLSQKTSSELRDVDEGIVEALKSVGDVLIEKEPKRETQSDVLADREMKTLLFCRGAFDRRPCVPSLIALSAPLCTPFIFANSTRSTSSLSSHVMSFKLTFSPAPSGTSDVARASK